MEGRRGPCGEREGCADRQSDGGGMAGGGAGKDLLVAKRAVTLAFFGVDAARGPVKGTSRF